MILFSALSAGCFFVSGACLMITIDLSRATGRIDPLGVFFTAGNLIGGVACLICLAAIA